MLIKGLDTDRLTEEETVALAIECLSQLTEEAVYRVLATVPKSVREEAAEMGEAE